MKHQRKQDKDWTTFNSKHTWDKKYKDLFYDKWHILTSHHKHGHERCYKKETAALKPLYRCT